VTHDARAATYADRVVFLQDGNIVREIRFLEGQEMHDRLNMVIKVFEELEAMG
jgi:ABC-type lipoprotein export system ATPase subunit